MSTDEVKDIGLVTSENEQNEEENDLISITSLPPKIQRFIQLYMTGQYTIPKLAQLLELHPNTIYNWLKRPDVRAVIVETQEATHEVVSNQLKALTAKAINKLSSLVDSPIDGVALQAVKDVLDRSGHKPKQEVKKEVTVRTFEEKLNEVISKTIDVEYELELEESEDEMGERE